MISLLLLVTHALATKSVVVDDVTATTLRVDERYVSSVLDPSSLACGASLPGPQTQEGCHPSCHHSCHPSWRASLSSSAATAR